MNLKPEGFKNQKAIVLPESIQLEMANNELTKLLFVTDIGIYPEARYHFRERPEGSPQHILIFCTQGSGWIESNGEMFKVKENQFISISAKTPHRYGSSENDPWTIYWLHYSGLQASLFFPTPISVTDIHFTENARNDRRLRLFDEIIQNFEMGYSPENLEYTSTCLWYLLASFKFLPQFERIRSIQTQDIIEKSIMYMQENIERKLELTDLAAYCGLSVSHYSMVFRKKTSRSPIDYFINLKIQRACQLLDFTEMRINEIATKLSFDDQFYFSRLFRKVMGASPIDYRRKKKG